MTPLADDDPALAPTRFARAAGDHLVLAARARTDRLSSLRLIGPPIGGLVLIPAIAVSALVSPDASASSIGILLAVAMIFAMLCAVVWIVRDRVRRAPVEIVEGVVVDSRADHPITLAGNARVRHLVVVQDAHGVRREAIVRDPISVRAYAVVRNQGGRPLSADWFEQPG